MTIGGALPQGIRLGVWKVGAGRKHRVIVALSCVLAVTVSALAWFGWATYHSYSYFHSVDPRIDRIEEVKAEVRYYDEVLTMSTRMAAATGDNRWERRYRSAEPLLTSAIEEVSTLAQDPGIRHAIDGTNWANQKLVDIENRVFALVRAGRLTDAQVLAHSREYDRLKVEYSEGLRQIDALLEAAFHDEVAHQRSILKASMVAVLLLVPLLIACWVALIRIANTWSVTLEERTTSLSRANEELLVAKETADEANLAKTMFLSRMSHELRTPLNAVLGFGAFLEDSELSEEQREDVSQIMSCSRHLLELINDVLDISRYEVGTRVVSFEPVNVLELTDECMKSLAPLATVGGITMEVDCPKELMVLADRRRLKQIVLNLASNAVKYNKVNGSVRIEVEACGDETLVRVKDTGVGIPPERVARLFVPFDRLGAEKGSVEGTGLGLVLAKAMVESMGGQLRVSSKMDVGTTFEFTLMTATRSAEAAIPSPIVSTNRNQRVLLIEDNPLNIQLLQSLFRDTGSLELTAVTRGSEGLEAAKELLPDAIILDINLPDISGHEVLSELKANSRLAKIPVIVVTANADPNGEDHTRRAGAFAHLKKPIVLHEVITVLNAALSEQARAA